MKKIILIFISVFSITLIAETILPMNRAFVSLVRLLPFMTDKLEFERKVNSKSITEDLEALNSAFGVAKHEKLLQQDIFAPSLKMVQESLSEATSAFKKGNKDYAHWRLKELTGQCMDCHSRIPTYHASSFQNQFKQIDPKRFKNTYNLGLAQMIVRLYPEAKATFTQDIDGKIIKKDFREILYPLKQILLIQTKIERNPSSMLALVTHYLDKKGLTQLDRMTLQDWSERLKFWVKSPYTKDKLAQEKDVEIFINKILKPLFGKDNLYVGKFDVDLLMASGLLSHFSFENPHSKLTPEILYWLGTIEKYLKRENFFGPGNLFLKQCIRRYPKSNVARKCLNEYLDSVEFDFSGSRGTDIPAEIKQELKELEKMISHP